MKKSRNNKVVRTTPVKKMGMAFTDRIPFATEEGENEQQFHFEMLKDTDEESYERIRRNLESIENFGVVKIYFDGYWIHFYDKAYKNFSGAHKKIKGKYLFFSTDDIVLYKIAVDEINNDGFYDAKVNARLIGRTDEYVLCLYFEDDSRKFELENRYRELGNIVKYRYWKSNSATIRGEYSNQFLEKLTP